MKFPFDEKALLYTELGKLSGAGFPLTEALDTVIDTHPPEATMSVLLAAKSSISGGSTIGEAFSASSEVPLTELETSIITASERGGVLEDGFDHLAGYFRMRHAARKEMRRKMVYPLVLLHVGLLIPILPLMLSSSNPKRVLILSLLALIGVYLLLFVVIVLGRKLGKKAETDAGAERLLARVPLIGNVRKNLSLARFASVFRMHLLAGERIDESLRSSAGASRSGRILEAIENRAIPDVANGQPVGPALAAHPEAFTATFARSFISAEDSGTLDKDLLRWSDRFQDSARTAMEKLATHAPKYFYIFAVLIALWQIFRLASFYLGTLNSLIDNIQ